MPEFVHNGERIRFSVDSTPRGTVLTLGDVKHELSLHEHGPGRFVITNRRGSFPVRVVRDKDRIWVWLAGRVVEFTIPGAEESAAAHRAHERDDIRAPMPGTMVKLLVAPGDTVERDQVVAVVEAMKMEHPLRAPRDGSVAAVFGEPGKIVDADAVVVSLVPEE